MHETRSNTSNRFNTPFTKQNDQEKKSKWGSIELYRVEIEKWNPGGHLSLSCRLELHKYPSVFISMAATAEIKLFGKW